MSVSVLLNMRASVGRAQGIFRAKLLDMILQCQIYDITHLSKLTEFYSPRVNPDGNYGSANINVSKSVLQL